MARIAIKFVACSTILAGLLAAIGYVPTKNVAGASAVPAMLAACGATLLASWIGSVPLFFAAKAEGLPESGAILAGSAIRFMLSLVAALAGALSGVVEQKPFLVWIGISYCGLLVVDTTFAVLAMKRQSRSMPGGASAAGASGASESE